MSDGTYFVDSQLWLGGYEKPGSCIITEKSGSSYGLSHNDLCSFFEDYPNEYQNRYPNKPANKCRVQKAYGGSGDGVFENWQAEPENAGLAACLHKKYFENETDLEECKNILKP
jgi:hypothetical protein